MTEQATSDAMLSKILSREWAAVLVVDVQNDFCHERGAMGLLGFDMKPVQSSVDVLVGFLGEARQAGVPIIFIATQHGKWTNSQAWLTRGPRSGGEICAMGSWGVEFYKLAPAPGNRWW